MQPDIYVLIYSFSIGFFPFGFISNIWTYLSWWYSSIWLILLLGLILFLSLWSIQWSRVLSMGLWCKLTYNPFFIGWRPSYTLVTYLLRRKQGIIGGGAGARKWNEKKIRQNTFSINNHININRIVAKLICLWFIAAR